MYRAMSIDNILETLVHHETFYCEKFKEQVELDIDDMIEGILNEFTKIKKTK